MNSPSVIVLTLNYNQNQYTLDCVRSVLKNNYTKFQLFLIDNGSSEESYKELCANAPNDDRLRILRLEKNIGYVGGVNFGLEQAERYNPDYYLVMNNDTLMDDGAINGLVICAEKQEKNAIVSGKVYNYDGTDTLQYIGNTYQDKGDILDFKAVVKNRREEDTGQYDQEMEMAMLDDIFWLIPRKIIDAIGLYSTYFFLYGEQTDYALRAVKAGFKLVYTPNAKLWHKGGITTDGGKKWLKSPKIEYWVMMAVLKLSVLHFSPKQARRFYYRFLVKTFVKKVLLLFQGKIKFEIIKSNYLAVKDFKFWNKIRYHDNGYNPY